jgi:hypothetical protein
MRHLGTLTGRGTVTSNDGQKVSVRYELRVSQDDPYAAIPGLKAI